MASSGRVRVPVTKAKVADVELELFDSGQGSRPPHPVSSRRRRVQRAATFRCAIVRETPRSLRRRIRASAHRACPTGSIATDDIAHLYLELMDVLKFDRVDLVGCSIGGWIAAEMATKAPERFSRIVLVGPGRHQDRPVRQARHPGHFRHAAGGGAEAHLSRPRADEARHRRKCRTTSSPPCSAPARRWRF